MTWIVLTFFRPFGGYADEYVGMSIFPEYEDAEKFIMELDDDYDGILINADDLDALVYDYFAKNTPEAIPEYVKEIAEKKMG